MMPSLAIGKWKFQKDNVSKTQFIHYDILSYTESESEYPSKN